MKATKTREFPDKLPFLPGNVYADPTITRYHKTQLLDLVNGVITGKCAPSLSVTLLLISHRKDNQLARTRQPRAARLHAEPGRSDPQRHPAPQAH